MKRFSGTVIPAPSKIERLPDVGLIHDYIVSWFDGNSVCVDVGLFVNNGRVTVEYIYRYHKEKYADIAEELFVQSAIANIQARVK